MNIYVGNLPYNVTEEDIISFFKRYGRVNTANLIKDRTTGESKGFGFVEMPSGKEAKAAIDGLNGFDIEGRAITVNEAIPKVSNGQSERRQKKHSGVGHGPR